MESQINYTTPLTVAEEKLIHQLSTDPDPLARLKSSYYPLRHRQVYSNYKAALKEEADSGVGDYKERQTLQERLLGDLDKLRKEYELDLNTSIQLHLMMQGVVSWKPAA